MVYAYIATAMCMVFAVATAYFEYKRSYAIKLVLKAVASALFCSVAFLTLYQNATNLKYGVMVSFALLFGLLGDVFLALGNLTDKKSADAFNLFGGACFALGHVFYIILFFSVAPFNYALLPFVLVLPLFLLLMLKLKQLRKSKLLVPLLLYSFVLGLMLISTINAFFLLGTTHALILMIASLCFGVSDMTLIFRDSGRDGLPLAEYLPFIVLIFYYAAQLMFALSIAL